MFTTTPYLRKFIGCQEGDYTITRIYQPKVIRINRRKIWKDRVAVANGVKHRTPETAESTLIYVEKHGELGFIRLPDRIKNILIAYNFKFGPRNPTKGEINEAESDHYEHRLHNNALTTRDLIKIYRKKRGYHDGYIPSKLD
jgi:hypothetical protein